MREINIKGGLLGLFFKSIELIYDVTYMTITALIIYCGMIKSIILFVSFVPGIIVGLVHFYILVDDIKRKRWTSVLSYTFRNLILIMLSYLYIKNVPHVSLGFFIAGILTFKVIVGTSMLVLAVKK